VFEIRVNLSGHLTHVLPPWKKTLITSDSTTRNLYFPTEPEFRNMSNFYHFLDSVVRMPW